MIMVEAGSHLKLYSTSICDIYKVFEHIDVLTISIWYSGSLLQLQLHYLAQILGFWFWVTCGVKMMSLHHG